MARAIQPQFTIGQLVHHKRFGYRGVVYDIDLEFQLDDEWYDAVAKSRPPKDQPWYRVLVHGSDGETYVAERHLEADASGDEVEHPLVDVFFDRLSTGHYVRDREMN